MVKGLSCSLFMVLVLALASEVVGQDGTSCAPLAPTRMSAGLVSLVAFQVPAEGLLTGANVVNLMPIASSVGQAKRVAPGKAFLLSLLLPGLGERTCGASTRGWALTATEATLWASMVAFRLYGHWRTQDYRAYAASKAGVSPEGKSHRYFVDIGNYASIDSYNAAMLRERNLAKVYQDTETYFWRWPSEVERIRYAHLRVSADNAYQRSLMIVGAILANHLVSAIDALWVARRTQQHASQGMTDVQFDFGCSPVNPGISVTVVRHF